MFGLDKFLTLGASLMSLSADPREVHALHARSTTSQVKTVTPKIADGHWVDTWTSMPQLTESTNLPNPPFNTSIGIFQNTTLRQTLHTSISAQQIRLRFSNVFGATSLPITRVTVALPFNGSAGVSAIETSTLQQVTFSGNSSIVIPDGSLAVSDPLNFPVEAQSMLSVSIYLEEGQAGWNITSHPGSRTNSWFEFGDHVDDANLTVTDPTDQVVAHWYFVSAVEGWVDKSNVGFGIIGDSITDGRGSDTDENNRWPDLVLAKMQANPSTSHIAVLNQAAGGNRILADGLGPAAIGRLDRDILAQSGIRYAMIFEGVNDIGVAPTDAASQQAIGDAVIQGLDQMITRTHALGIPIFGATITPFGAPNTTIQPYSDPTRDATRRRVNEWILTSGRYDATIDFDALLRDPANTSQLNPIYNSGDFLHPNVAGYQHLADNFPLDIFTKFAGGVQGFT